MYEKLRSLKQTAISKGSVTYTEGPVNIRRVTNPEIT